MRIGEIKATASRPARATPAAPMQAEPAAESRALVAVAPLPPPREPSVLYRQAPFLAQLIATRAQHPQTRGRRRAEPAEALAAYRATASLVP